jgi:hypothetical protein
MHSQFEYVDIVKFKTFVVDGLGLVIELVKCNTYILRLRHVNITLSPFINILPRYGDECILQIYIILHLNVSIILLVNKYTSIVHLLMIF